MAQKIKVVSIDSNNVDFYLWGRNCKVLGYTMTEAQSCIETDMYLESNDYDDFWCGYSSL